MTRKAKRKRRRIDDVYADRDQLLAACKRMLTFEEWKKMLGDENRAASYLDAIGKLRAAIDKAESEESRP